MIWQFYFFFRLFTVVIEPRPLYSWCKHYTNVTTEESKRSVEYPVTCIFSAPWPHLDTDIGKNASAWKVHIMPFCIIRFLIFFNPDILALNHSFKIHFIFSCCVYYVRTGIADILVIPDQGCQGWPKNVQPQAQVISSWHRYCLSQSVLKSDLKKSHTPGCWTQFYSASVVQWLVCQRLILKIRSSNPAGHIKNFSVG